MPRRPCLYAQAFGKDPAFAQFYRSPEAYKASFANKSDMLVLDPSSEFFGHALERVGCRQALSPSAAFCRVAAVTR